MARLLTAIGVIAGALGAALAAGCGGGGEGESSRAVTVRAGASIRIVGDEYSFDPRGVIVAGAGEGAPARLRIALANEGALAHNLKLFRDDRQIGGTPTFQGGRTRAGSVELTPGSYRMVCTVGNHEELGMTGRLEVRAGG